ncbi:tannase and feruloyl esterase-domain-containing protein [Aspergillus tetrazonus]
MVSWILHCLAASSCALASQVQKALCEHSGCDTSAGAQDRPAIARMAVEQAPGGEIPPTLSADELCSGARIPFPELYGLEIQALTATDVRNFTFPAFPPLTPEPVHHNMDFCNVTVAYTHPGWNDQITVTVLLPFEGGWNGRAQATGGGGFVTGGGPIGDLWMGDGLAGGTDVAVSATDATEWALLSPGNVNRPLFIDFASAVATSYYGQPPSKSYFFGGSTGGRQALMLAQKYPRDFDGIVSVCPAANWDRFILGVYPPPCELNAFTRAAIEACDGLDGVVDEIISLPGLCDFDPHSVVGSSFDCNGKPSTYTRAGAAVAEAAWSGPRGVNGEWQWFGIGKDADLSGIALTACDDNERNCKPIPFGIPDSWIRNFLKKDAQFDPTTLTHEEWDTLFHQSTNEYASPIGTSDPDLSEFRKAGGRLVSWHGLRDEVISVNGSANYFDRVLQHDPNAHEYFRLFLVPGAGHSTVEGLTPKNAMDALVQWVEEEVAPETLRADGGQDRYGVQVYVSGDHTVPSSFKCVD